MAVKALRGIGAGGTTGTAEAADPPEFVEAAFGERALMGVFRLGEDKIRYQGAETAAAALSGDKHVIEAETTEAGNIGYMPVRPVA
jgi:hypothetical protein